MNHEHVGHQPRDDHLDLIGQIPDPETVRDRLAESIRETDLLRSLLRVAIRKAAYTPAPPSERQEVDSE